MKVNEFVNWPYAYNVQISPDGDHVVFQVTTANEKKNAYETNLWVYRARDGKIFPLTSSDQEGHFEFLDENLVLFQSGRDQEEEENKYKTNYWMIHLDGGEARSYFSIELAVSKIKPINDQLYLVSGYDYPRKEEDWHEINHLPFWLNGKGYTEGLYSRLYIFDAHKYAKLAKENRQNEKGKEKKDKVQSNSEKNQQIEKTVLTPITANTDTINDWALSSDKKHLVYSASPLDPVMSMKNNLYYYNMDSGESQEISHQEYAIHSIHFTEDSKKALIFAADGESNGINEDPQIYQVELDTLEMSRLSKDDFDHSPGNSVGTDARYGSGQAIKVYDGKLYFIETKSHNAILSAFTKEGQVETILASQGSIESFDFHDHLLYFFAMEDLKLPELYVSDGNSTAQITDFSKSLNPDQVAPIEDFDFTSNGAELKGFVIKPLNYEAGKKYPGILSIHGGPKTVFSSILHHEMQLLANKGYFVFYTNPHGSDGHGVDFSDIRGKYGSIDYEDLMHFTDLVLEKYEDIDEDCLGVMGGSYGGFMTNWIIGHTDRFKAANSQRSISNWTSFYGVSDIGYYFAQDQTASNPWDNIEDMWGQSPLKYARQAVTPTLFIHADQDLRCPLEQGMQMYTALQLNDVDTRLVVFKNETHELSRSGKPAARVKRLEEILEWFDKYLVSE